MREGPTLKSFFTCIKCEYLITSIISDFGKYPYKCFHDDVIRKNLNIIRGDIGSDKITPAFCPFLIKKLRTEKFKEIL